MKRKRTQEKLIRVSKYIRVYRKLICLDGKWIERKKGKIFVGEYLKDTGIARRKAHKRSFFSVKEAEHFALYGNRFQPLKQDSFFSFNQAWESWETKSKTKVEEQTWARYLSYRKHFDFFAKMDMQAITVSTIDQWFAHIRSKQYLATQRSTRVDYRHEVSVLKQILRHYRERENHNYVWPFLKEHSEMIDLGRRKQSREKDLRPEEVHKFLKCLKVNSIEANQETVYWILSIQYALCLRVQEAAALSFEDFDFERNEITVNRRVVWARSKGFKTRIESGTKANPGKTIPLSTLAKKIFMEWTLRSGIRNGYLFFLNGEPLSYRQIEYRCTRALQMVGLPFRATHLLRHAALTEYYAQSRDLKATQVMAGHGNIKSTERYVKARKEDMAIHIERLDDAQSLIQI